MKAHRYEIEYCADMFHQAHNNVGTQTVIYVPNFAVFGFINMKEIIFFSEELGTPEKFQERMEERGGGKYLGEIELNDEEFFQFLDAGKKLNGAKRIFKKASKSLLDTLK